MPFRCEPLYELCQIRMGLESVAACDPHELEPSVLLCVVGGQVGAQRLYLLDGPLDQLGEQARRDRLDCAQKDGLDGPVLFCDAHHVVVII